VKVGVEDFKCKDSILTYNKCRIVMMIIVEKKMKIRIEEIDFRIEIDRDLIMGKEKKKNVQMMMIIHMGKEMKRSVSLITQAAAEDRQLNNKN